MIAVLKAKAAPHALILHGREQEGAVITLHIELTEVLIAARIGKYARMPGNAMKVVIGIAIVDISLYNLIVAEMVKVYAHGLRRQIGRASCRERV